jgi:hypothetical protein
MLIYHLEMNNRPPGGRSSDAFSPHRHDMTWHTCNELTKPVAHFLPQKSCTTGEILLMSIAQCKGWGILLSKNLWRLASKHPHVWTQYIDDCFNLNCFSDLIYSSICKLYCGSRVSSGSIVSDHGLDDRSSIPGRGKGFFFYPLYPDRLWGPPNFLANGYRGSFPRG